MKILEVLNEFYGDFEFDENDKIRMYSFDKIKMYK